ncbi:MAG: hypothetical protein LC104_17255 [Bacteroidales bacterium]|nr:hypothetical protein [Bacteroidales bacterium]
MSARYRAPTANRAVLADPSRLLWPQLVQENRHRLATAMVRIDGEPLHAFREQARTEILAVAHATQSPVETDTKSDDAPLVVSGHQPELFHPGVWVKNFALCGLAQRVSGVSLNLVVDNDTLKSSALRIPTWTGRDPATVHLSAVPFDTHDNEQPYEIRGIHDAALFHSFAERAASLWNEWGYEPLLPRAWACILRQTHPSIGARFAAVRRCFEQEWGCLNRELPVSQLARTTAFARFVRHILTDLPRFRAIYNRVVQEYREQHGIRSRNHPVPDLAANEAPFWSAPDAQGQRGRLMSSEFTDATVLRPRALTLTLFTRLCLGDFFIHGIGGGKYDEVTDAIIRDYFQIEPPRFGVLSATLHLPLPGFPHTFADVRRCTQQARDLFWNPQRHGTDFADLSAKKAQLIAAEPADPVSRQAWFQKLRQVTEQMRPFVQDQRESVERALAPMRQEAAANAILQRRDYSWVLYPEPVLRPFLQSFLG